MEADQARVAGPQGKGPVEKTRWPLRIGAVNRQLLPSLARSSQLRAEGQGQGKGSGLPRGAPNPTPEAHTPPRMT